MKIDYLDQWSRVDFYLEKNVQKYVIFLNLRSFSIIKILNKIL